MPSRNPLFRGAGSPETLGDLLQLWGGSPHPFGSLKWKAFGRALALALKRHLEASGLDGQVRDFRAATEWSKSKDATTFFNNYIPPEGRGRNVLFYARNRRT